MARRSTWLVVGVLAIIGLAAAVDSLRGSLSGDPSAAPATTLATPAREEAPPAEPAAGEFGGILYYTDASCELRAVRLPALEPEQAPNWDECRFILSPDGKRVSESASGWDPHSDARRGRLFRSNGTSILVSTNGGPEAEPIRGTAPAWRPTGTLTYVAGRAVREWPTGRVVLSADDLAVAVRAHPDVPDSGRARAVAVGDLEWLDDARLAVVLSVPVERAVEYAVAVFEGRRLAWVQFGGARTLFDLRVSVTGRFLAVKDGLGVLLFDGRRGRLEVPTFAEPVYGITWSPDEAWVAVAGGGRVFILRPGDETWTASLNLEARDLAWRGEAQPAPLVSTEAAREWLADAGATGRLFVTESTCRLSALRLPTLEWEDEPARARAPCRFILDASGTVLADNVSAAPVGELTATCEPDGLNIFQSGGFRASLPNACGAAWMGDGSLTFVRDGGLWQGIEDPRRLVSRAQVSTTLGRSSALEEVAWVDDRRFWAVVRSGEGATLALLEATGELVYSPSFTAQRVEGLRVSTTGMVAATTERGVVFFDNGGRRAMSFPGATAVAWAPDSLVAAVAGPREILFVAPISREVVALPLPVEDLEWVVP